MIVSLNEIEGTVLKAARGAGLSWGLAEEAAAAARWLAVAGFDWVPTLATLLTTNAARAEACFDGARLAPEHGGGTLCPIRAGAFLSDLGLDDRAITIERVAAPLWLLPLLARAASPTACVEVLMAEESIVLAPSGIVAGAAAAATLAEVQSLARLTARVGAMSAAAPTARAPVSSQRQVPDGPWRALQQLESATYVSSSHHSRLAGAGAGLTDND